MLPEFDDGKEPGALRTIGEVSRALGVRHHVLRYWEEQFPMLRPIKRSGGRRYYRPEDVALIVEIVRLVHQEGYTLRGARAALSATTSTAAPRPRKSAGKAAANAASSQVPATAAQIAPAAAADPALMAELRSIREELSEALARA